MTGKQVGYRSFTWWMMAVIQRAGSLQVLALMGVIWILGLLVDQGWSVQEVVAQQAKEASPEVYQKIYTGWKFWHVYCYRCHGVDALGSVLAPNLRESVKVLTPEEFFTIVHGGRVPKGMPAFNQLLDDDQIRDIRLYIKARSEGMLPPGRPDEVEWTIPEGWPKVAAAQEAPEAETTAQAPGASSVKGDPAAGEQLFFDTQTLGADACVNCHIVNEKGNEVGPILSKIGRRSPDYLRESILNPNAVIAPGYGTIVIVTKGGRNITGVKKGEDDASMQVATSEGDLQTIPKNEIQQTIQSRTSLMPNNYGELLTDQQLNDLMAYLLTLR